MNKPAGPAGLNQKTRRRDSELRLLSHPMGGDGYLVGERPRLASIGKKEKHMDQVTGYKWTCSKCGMKRCYDVWD